MDADIQDFLPKTYPRMFTNCGKTISVGILNPFILFPDEILMVILNNEATLFLSFCEYRLLSAQK